MLKLNSNSFSSRVSKDQVLFPLIIGMSSALMASPCSSPILGSVLRLQSLPRAGNWMNHIHRLSSVIMIIAGLYYLYQGFFER